MYILYILQYDKLKAILMAHGGGWLELVTRREAFVAKINQEECGPHYCDTGIPDYVAGM